MVKPVSSTYLTVEAATTGAELAYYVTFRRIYCSMWGASQIARNHCLLMDAASGTKEGLFYFADNDTASYVSKLGYFIDGWGGSHMNTQVKDDGNDNTLELVSSASVGYWKSQKINTQFPSSEIVCDLVKWEETLNGGTVSVHIRSAVNSPALDSATFYAVSNGIQNHTRRKPWIQFKINLSAIGAGRPEVADPRFRAKAVLPCSEIIQLPVVFSSIGEDFLSIVGGTATLIADNRSKKWDDLYSNSYIYNKNYFEDTLDIMAGFKPPDGTKEFLTVFSGKIDKVQLRTGISGRREATITAKNLIIERLDKVMIGTPKGDGTPNPYFSGRRYREPLVEVDPTNNVWVLYCKQAVSSINAVYERSTTTRQWRLTPINHTIGVDSKSVTFDYTPGGEIAVDVTINDVEHPMDIILDILQNEVGLYRHQYDMTTINNVKNLRPTVKLGVRFENISALEAIRQLCHAIDVAAFVDGEQLKFVPIETPTAGGQHFQEREYENLRYDRTKEHLINLARIPFGNYEEDKTKLGRASNIKSIYDYGLRELQKFYPGYSLTYQDSVSCSSAYLVNGLAQTLIDRLSYPKKRITLERGMLYGLRTELGDKGRVSNAFLGLSEASFVVCDKKIDLNKKRVELKLIDFSE